MIRPKGKGIVRERDATDFDKAVLATSFNGRDPGRRPEVFVEANDVFDVINAVKRANRDNLKISICSGGHSWAQNHLREGGLLLSMARLNSIEVKDDIAIVGPGCWSVDLDTTLKKQGLFFPVAHAPDVCLGGFLLQGGFGWGSTRFGLACQSVVGIDVVLADGSLVHANASENADLYWSARGAGPGFFGVVIRYHLKLFKRPRFTGMKMQVFREKHLEKVFTWADSIGPDVSKMVEFQMLITPKAMGIFSPGLEVLAPVLADSYKEAKEAVAFLSDSPIRKDASLTTPLVPLSTAFLAHAANITHFPPGLNWCTDNMWTDNPIGDLLPGIRKVSDTMPPAPSHALWLNWQPPAKRPDMAFSRESKRYFAVYGEWRDPKDNAKWENWATERMTELAPFSNGIQLADENLGRRPAKFLSDENMRKLQTIRAKYDPNEVFHSWMGHISV